MKHLIFLSVVAALFATACTNAGPKSGEYTDTGYRYIHHVKNQGNQPQAGDYVYYKVTIFADDSLVYNSRDEATAPRVVMPDSAALKTNPSPVIDVLYLMATGDSLTLFYPLDSMPQRPPGYEKTEMIRYEIVVDSIQTPEAFEKQQALLKEKAQRRLAEIRQTLNDLIDKYKKHQLGSDLKTTDSGLQYVVLEEGEGPAAQTGQMVSAQYLGVLLEDGKQFDESFSKGRPFAFPVGQGRVIPGWDEGFQLLNKGSKAVLFIPYKLAYGEAGSPPVIPEKADLVFYVELEDIK